MLHCYIDILLVYSVMYLCAVSPFKSAEVPSGVICISSSLQVSEGFFKILYYFSYDKKQLCVCCFLSFQVTDCFAIETVIVPQCVKSARVNSITETFKVEKVLLSQNCPSVCLFMSNCEPLEEVKAPWTEVASGQQLYFTYLIYTFVVCLDVTHFSTAVHWT